MKIKFPRMFLIRLPFIFPRFYKLATYLNETQMTDVNKFRLNKTHKLISKPRVD